MVLGYLGPTKGRVVILQGDLIKARSGDYFLNRAVTFNYLDHQGAYAGIYIEDPLNPGSFLREAPNLEKGDRFVAARETLKSLIGRLKSLESKKAELGKKGENLGAQEKEDLAKLADLFSAIE